MSAEKPNAQARILAVVEALSGHEVFGLRLKEVADLMRAPMPQTLRDLQTLAGCGWAEQKEGRWRLGPKPVQIATRFSWGLTQAKQAVAEVEHNYTRSLT